MNNSINPSSIKEKIKENKSVLINITEVNDFLLTELVGEKVMEQPTKERILDGRTRTEINKRFFEWLSECDGASVYEIFLLKLREFGQQHIANLLDGTPGELPLTQEVRQSLQKKVRELAENIDLDSGLLDNLAARNVISKIDCQYIKAEKTPIDQAKSLWDVLLRGSDRAFEKFKVEIMKMQPQMIQLIENQHGTVNKPHVDCLIKHYDVLTRCMDINLVIISSLEARRVIDRCMAESLEATSENVKKTDRVYHLLLSKSKDVYDLFLQTMQNKEQKHVANLLMENSSGQQPLSEADYYRLVSIKSDLITKIHSSVDLISAMRGDQENEHTDFAISLNDYEVINTKCLTNTEKNCALFDAVLRRTDYSLKSFQKALRETKQEDLANYLKEGMLFGADVKTTRTDKEEQIINLFNRQIQLSQEPSSDEERQFAEEGQFAEELNMLRGRLNIPVIAAEASESIMIYSYCKQPADVERYIKYLKSGQLQVIYERMLNLLLKMIEPDTYEPLETAIILKDENGKILLKFNEYALAQTYSMSGRPACSLCGKLMDIFSYDSSSTACSSCVEQEDQSHDCSDVNEEIASQRRKLQEDLKLVSSCRSKSIELKESVKKKQANFFRQMEASKAAVSKKCQDLKDKVENFKQMLLKDQEKFKKHIEGVMGEQIRALESYGSVVSDFEGRLKRLTESGSSKNIRMSFNLLHERALKLQKIPEQPSRNVTEILQELEPEQKSFLVEYLDPESGLLHQLVALRALSDENAAEIRKLSSYREMNRKLIESIITDDKCQQLVSALVASKQSHLLNYLESQGKYDAKYGHIWPVMEPERNRLDLMRDQLPCLLIPFYFNLLQIMNVLNLWHVNFILSKPSLEAKCDALLEILKRGSLDDFFKVDNFLTISQDQSHMKPLVLHRVFLGTSLDPDSGLVDMLKPCLSLKEFRSIKTERSSLKRNLKLVDAMSGSNKYDEFIKALMETGQRHIANFLNANGVYDQKFAGEWPAVCSNGWEILNRNRKSLVDNIKLRDFLLDGFISKNVINSKQRDTLSQIQSKRDRNEAFMDMLGRGSIENYNKAVELFHASGQTDVAIWLGRPPEPAFGRVQVQVQVQVNLEQERAELLSVFNEVMAFHQIGLLHPLQFEKQRN